MIPTLSKKLILAPTHFDYHVTELHICTIKRTAIIVLLSETIELTIIMQTREILQVPSPIVPELRQKQKRTEMRTI